MSKVKLQLQEIPQLNQELFLLQGEKEVNFALKYEIAKVFERTTKIVKDYTELRNKIIETHGVLVEGSKTQHTLEGSKDKDKGDKEIKALAEKIEEFDASFKLEDFKDLKSENHYIQFMKLLKN